MAIQARERKVAVVQVSRWTDEPGDEELSAARDRYRWRKGLATREFDACRAVVPERVVHVTVSLQVAHREAAASFVRGAGLASHEDPALSADGDRGVTLRIEPRRGSNARDATVREGAIEPAVPTQPGHGAAARDHDPALSPDSDGLRGVIRVAHDAQAVVTERAVEVPCGPRVGSRPGDQGKTQGGRNRRCSPPRAAV